MLCYDDVKETPLETSIRCSDMALDCAIVANGRRRTNTPRDRATKLSPPIPDSEHHNSREMRYEGLLKSKFMIIDRHSSMLGQIQAKAKVIWFHACLLVSMHVKLQAKAEQCCSLTMFEPRHFSPSCPILTPSSNSVYVGLQGF